MLTSLVYIAKVIMGLGEGSITYAARELKLFEGGLDGSRAGGKVRDGCGDAGEEGEEDCELHVCALCS